MTTLNATIHTTPTATPAADILAGLRRPFRNDQVSWKPSVVANGKALAIPYVSACTLQERLDEVCGAGWETRFTVLPNGSMVCTLRLCIDGVWYERSDAGEPGKGDNATKAAATDAFKRACRAWGLARHLCFAAKQWCAYDQQKRRFTEQPRLPELVRPTQAPAAPEQEQAVLTRIQEGQEQQIVQLLRQSGADIQAFLRHFKIKSVGSLSQGDFPAAVQLLRRKLAGNGNAAGNGSSTPKG